VRAALITSINNMVTSQTSAANILMCFKTRNCISYIMKVENTISICKQTIDFILYMLHFVDIVWDKSRNLSAKSLAIPVASVWPSTEQLVPVILDRICLISDQKSRALLVRRESASLSLIILSSQRLTLRIE